MNAMLKGDHGVECECLASRRQPLRRIVLEWASANPHPYPWRAPGTSPWGILTAEMMLQRTKAPRVVPIWSEFATRYPSPLAVVHASTEVMALLRPLGLNKRAGSLVALAEQLALIGSIPDERDDLMQLPGIGAYTADAYLCLTQSAHRMPIDSNISRLAHRLAGCDPVPQAHRTAAARRLVEACVGDNVTAEMLQAILDFAMEVCSPLPRCTGCPLRASNLCVYNVPCQRQGAE